MYVTKHIALAIALVIGANATASLAQGQDHIQWAPDYQQALRIAAQQQRLVMLHFWNDNCPPCRTLEQRVFPRPEVIRALHTNYVPVKVHVGQNPQLRDKYKVNSWPTDVIITANEQEVHRAISKQDPNQYIAMLDGIAATHRVYAGRTAQNQTTTPQHFSTPGSPLGAAAAGPNAGSFDPAAHQQQPSAAPRPTAGAGNFAANSQSQRAASALAPGGGFDPTAYSPTAPPATSNSFQPPAKGNSTAAAGNYSPPSANQQASNPAMPNHATSSQATNNPYFPPAQTAATPTPEAGEPAAGAAPPAQRRAIDGYCPVTLVENNRWQQGDAKYGVIHRDRLYLFAGPAEKQQFWANPDRYSPVLSGFDPVQFAEQRQLVAGHREHGVMFRNQIYLFADEASLAKFWTSPDEYAAAIYQAMQESTKGAVRR